MPSWPGSLPQDPVWNALQATGPNSGWIRTQMDVGPAKERRRSTTSPRVYQMTLAQVTEAQLATFETFFESTLQMGTLAFDMNDPITGASKSWRFFKTNGGYSISPMTRDEYRITFTLERLT